MAQLIIQNFDKGLVSDEVLSTTSFDPAMASDALNVEWDPKYTLSKRKGLERAHSTAWVNSAIVKTYPYITAAQNDYHLAFSTASGTASAEVSSFTISGATTTFTSVVSGGVSLWNPAVTDPIDVDTYSGSAFMTYQSNSYGPLIWSGTGSATALTSLSPTGAPSGAEAVCAWGDFLFLGNVITSGGTRYRSKVMWCYPGNFLYWPTSYYTDYDPDDGDEITAITLLSDMVVVFKQRKTFVTTWVGGKLLFDSVRKSAVVGCVGPNAVCEYKGTLFFLNEDGVYAFDGNSPPELISTPIRDKINNLNKKNLDISHAFYHPVKKQIWFLVPYGSSTIKDYAYVYDLDFKSWMIFQIDCGSMSEYYSSELLTFGSLPLSYGSYSISLSEARGEKSKYFIVGTHDGFITKYGDVNYDCGAAINAYWKSMWLFLDDNTKTKRAKRLTFILDKKGDINLDVKLYKDYDASTALWTETVPMSGTPDVLEKRVDFTQQARSFMIEVGTDSGGEPFTIHRIIMDYDMKGATLV